MSVQAYEQWDLGSNPRPLKAFVYFFFRELHVLSKELVHHAPHTIRRQVVLDQIKWLGVKDYHDLKSMDMWTI